MVLDQVQLDSRTAVVEDVVEVVAAVVFEVSWVEAAVVDQGSEIQVVAPDLGNFLVGNQVLLVCHPHSAALC